MEIVLAVLLLFGGFTLGSITADKGGDEQSTMALPNADSVPDSHQVTQATRRSHSTGCHSDGSIIYRDLTLPYHGQVGLHASLAGDRDEGCSDE